MIKRRFADNRVEGSVAAHLRKQRFQLFVELVNTLPPVVNVLDVGGTQDYWVRVTKGSAFLDKVQITLLNLQFLPLSLQVWLLQHFKLGNYPKRPDYQDALSAVRIIRLMTQREIEALFPNGKIYKEKYLGLTKSIIVYTPTD